MARVNLLPWREELRQERKKRFLIMGAAAVVLTLLIFGGVHLYVAGMIDYQNQRNAYLKEEIKKAEKKIEEIKDLEAERERLFARMKIIQELQTSRPEVVHLFDEIVTTLPEGVYYTSLKQNNDKITLQGRAQSSARVATLMRNLEQSEWLNPSWLNVVKNVGKKEEKAGQEFTLQVQQINPNAKKKEEEKKKAGKK